MAARAASSAFPGNATRKFPLSVLSVTERVEVSQSPLLVIDRIAS
jgi:hypothetical protein